MRLFRRLNRRLKRHVNKPNEPYVNDVTALLILAFSLAIAGFILGMFLVWLDWTYDLESVIGWEPGFLGKLQEIAALGSSDPTGAALGVSPAPRIYFDKDFYRPVERLVVTVEDADAKNAAITIFSSTDREGVDMNLLPKGGGYFESEISLAEINANYGDMVVAKYSYREDGQIVELFAEAFVGGG